MANELTIVTLTDSNTKKEMKLQGKWAGDVVEILLNDGVTSSTGKFSLDEVGDATLSQLEMSRKEYFERMRSALGTTSANPKFRYTFEDDSLSWAKLVTPDVSVLYGRITLKPVAATNHGQLVRSLLDSYSSVLEELTESVARYNRLEREYQDINSAFENCCRIKSEMETTLYSKFAQILNEKKEYVRRVTGNQPDEDFGPVPYSKPAHTVTAANTTTMRLKDFSKMIKRDSSATSDRPSKKPMLDPQPSTSKDFMEEMDF